MTIAVSSTEVESTLRRLEPAPPKLTPVPFDSWTYEERRAAIDAWHAMHDSFRARCLPVDWVVCEAASIAAVQTMRGNVPEYLP